MECCRQSTNSLADEHPLDTTDTPDAEIHTQRLEGSGREVQVEELTGGAAVSDRDGDSFSTEGHLGLTAAQLVVVGVAVNIELVKELLAHRSDELRVVVGNTTGGQTGVVEGTLTRASASSSK